MMLKLDIIWRQLAGREIAVKPKQFLALFRTITLCFYQFNFTLLVPYVHLLLT